MARLPVPGDDDNLWGDILNEFLEVTHETDGTVNASSIVNTPSGTIVSTTVQGAIDELATEKADESDLLTVDDATLEQAGSTLRVRQPISTFVEFTEMTAPSAPAANRARLFVRDNAGKTELCVMFSDGSIQMIKAQP